MSSILRRRFRRLVFRQFRVRRFLVAFDVEKTPTKKQRRGKGRKDDSVEIDEKTTLKSDEKTTKETTGSKATKNDEVENNEKDDEKHKQRCHAKKL